MSKAPRIKMNPERREQAIAALARHALVEPYRALLAREREAFDLAYALAVPAKIQAALAEIPESWFYRNDRLTVNANGWVVPLHAVKPESADIVLDTAGRRNQTYIWRIRQGRATSDVPFPYNERFNQIILDDELAGRVQTLAQDRDKFNETVSDLSGQLVSTIGAFTYVDNLLAAIPELVELAPDLTRTVEKQNALVPNVQGVMCKIASLRGEARDGCGQLAAE